ncbi:NADP(H)-dependent aldo-keto reductase [Lacibacterium aquatile]|uniref:NADP(H)-dependent aldo-keto reductase n=1 Tax=Lacibacterium aquatile TaxID=1168082 RepID=A0ABW5DL92_9PROT
MQYRRLGRTDLDVSVICLGTMTWGEQNTEAEAHAQIDYALAQGINFMDAAEMYPVPSRAETQGLTETFIGTWIAANKGKRDKLILASKVAGGDALPARRMAHIRNGYQRPDRKGVTEALEQSLKRLQTDYIDLYQIHWPDRSTNMFGQLGYEHVETPTAVPLSETLGVLAEFVKAGKIRHIGLSNETPWGLMECIRLAEQAGIPRIVSVQNPYSLLNRSYEVGLAEMSIREQTGLLAYSPLAMGVLTGKYLGGAMPKGSRLSLFERFKRYSGPRGTAAAERYVGIAKQFGLDPAQMALAYVNSRPFLTSNIIGATSVDQLKINIDSINIKLAPEVLAEIEKVHQDNPNPCP